MEQVPTLRGRQDGKCNHMMRSIINSNQALRTLALLLLSVISSYSLALTPTSQQIEMFNSLSPEQKKALASQYGVSLDDLELNSAGREPANKIEEPNVRATRDDISMFEPSIPPNGHKSQSETQGIDTTLKQFGYDLFEGGAEAFTPVSDIPPPDSYVLGPGDNLAIQLYGKENSNYNLTINRNGQIHFPQIGPTTLAGLTFSDAQELIISMVDRHLIGVKASVTMGSLRSVRIFVLGEAMQPGSYTVSSLSTMTNALFASGGVSKVGSLREIQLKRRGKLVTTLDLYDLLLRGDTSKDARLLPGDVIFIPPIGPTIGITGEVKRPAIYELKDENTAIQAIMLSGGFTPKAYPPATRIYRITALGDRTVLDTDLSNNKGRSVKISDAYTIEVLPVLETLEDIVTLTGHTERPGDYAWRPGMRVTDIIKDPRELLPFPDLKVALIERETQPTREKTVLAFNLGQALKNPSSQNNLILEPRDILHVFDFEADRPKELAALTDRLKLQASKEYRKQTVQISGHVRFPGEYPLAPQMNINDAIALAGGLTENAYGLHGELTRITYNSQEEQSINHQDIDLARSDDFILRAEDQLNIKRLPNWLDQQIVTIEGQVRFPGTYQVKRGETLDQLLVRAGGLNQWAYSKGAIFTREELRVLEEERLRELREKLEGDIAATNLEVQSATEKVAAKDAEDLLDKLKTIRPLGRMVIDLDAVLTGKAPPISLKDGDKLVIPENKQAVTVVGEVQFPTSHIFDSSADAAEYIEMSGGTTQKADNERIYVVKANGRVFLPESSGWFKSANYKIEAGDTVVVPLDADRIKPLTLWTSVSQIFYQIALGAAAVASF